MNKHQEELLLNDYYTIGVQSSSEATSKHYTYKVDNSIDLVDGDLVVVLAGGEYKIVCVAVVHETNEVNFNTNFDYKYIIDKIDFTVYRKLQERSKTIAKTLAEAARRKLKSEMLESLTNDISDEEVKKLAATCGNDFLGDK